MNSMNRHGAAAGELSWHDSTSGAIVGGLPHSFCGPSPFLVESHRRCKAPLQHWRVSFHSPKLKLKLPNFAPGAQLQPLTSLDACRRFSPSLLCGRSMMRVASKVLRCGCRHCPRDSWSPSESWKWLRGSRRGQFGGHLKWAIYIGPNQCFAQGIVPCHIYIYYTNRCFFSDFRHGHHDISWHIMTSSNSSTKQT